MAHMNRLLLSTVLLVKYTLSLSLSLSSAGREVRKLGAALARQTGQDEGEAASHLWRRLGILLQRGNAAILGNRVPALPRAYVDGVL